MKKAVLTVDTDRPGFFRKKDQASLDFVLREFGVRIRLEMLLLALIAPGGAQK